MKKILIALDNNAGAQKVAASGYKLSEALHARTILMHVTSASNYFSSLNYSHVMGFDTFSNLDVAQTNAVDELKRTAQDNLNNAKLSLGDETIETVLKEGDYAENILQTAKEVDADIIVVGTHSRKGLDKVLLGSVAEKVLRNSTIPLFIIPVKNVEEE